VVYVAQKLSMTRIACFDREIAGTKATTPKISPGFEFQ
jgi:hypothetical protein